jgi:hypothetical protein
MPEIENLKNSAERCFELASSNNFMERMLRRSIQTVSRQRV